MFPLPGALLLPPGAIAAQYLLDALIAMIGRLVAGHRIIGMVQPIPAEEDAKRRRSRGQFARRTSHPVR